MFSALFALLRGLDHSPRVVGTARAAAEAAGFEILYSAGDFLAAGGFPDQVGQFVPVAILLIRTLEGVLDHLDPAKSRQRPEA